VIGPYCESEPFSEISARGVKLSGKLRNKINLASAQNDDGRTIKILCREPFSPIRNLS
jgi:hypothetical protein